jgi:hypothetical protein
MLRIVAAVPCVLFALLAPAAAQKWPERTVRIIVPYNAIPIWLRACWLKRSGQNSAKTLSSRTSLARVA